MEGGDLGQNQAGYHGFWPWAVSTKKQKKRLRKIWWSRTHRSQGERRLHLIRTLTTTGGADLEKCVWMELTWLCYRTFKCKGTRGLKYSSREWLIPQQAVLRNFPRESVGKDNEGLDEFLGTHEEVILRLKRTEKNKCGQLLLWLQRCFFSYNIDVSKPD